MKVSNKIHQLDPFDFAERFWPDVTFYQKQKEITLSVRDDAETYVVAGNMLGKDFVSAFIILWYYVTHVPCKIVTTSANEKHLINLWGEISRFVRTAKHPLNSVYGGPLVCNHQHVRRIYQGTVLGEDYIISMVARSAHEATAIQGHHAPYTLWVCDEASAVPNVAYDMACGWAKRKLIIGNPWPCTNFFYRGVKAGDLLAV